MAGLKPVLWLSILYITTAVFFTKEGSLLFEFGSIKIYEEGVRQGIFISLRFFFLILMTSSVNINHDTN